MRYSPKLAAEAVCPECTSKTCDGCAINNAMLAIDNFEDAPFIEDLDFDPDTEQE